MAIPMDDIGARLSDIWSRYLSASDEDNATISRTALQRAPLIWLLGRVQSGKSSIVQAITGCSEAEIGSGFRPCTRTAQVFDYPAEAPLASFLDTRGLGEIEYDPEEDIATAMQRAHLLLVVVRAMDQRLEELNGIVSDVRKKHPDWPVVVAQTCLHEAYDRGGAHILPYPFDDDESVNPKIPIGLMRSLRRQRETIERAAEGGPISFVPVDFTQPEDGFEPRFYGLEALVAAIAAAAPEGVLAILKHLRTSGADRLALAAHPRILGHASAAAFADAVPLAGAVAVPGVQARLLFLIGKIYGVTWDRRLLAQFAGCLGGGVVARLLTGLGVRQLAKLIPVYGQTVGAATSAAASYATTYAIGKAAEVFLSHRKLGQQDDLAVAEAYREALETALGLSLACGEDGNPTTVSDDATR